MASYRRSVSLVPEDVTLFRGTLGENVLLGRDLGDAREVLLRLERLGFDRLLARYPERWMTRLGEGSRPLSSGERQVIGFLRGLASRPSLLLVDEGLRGTDSETEELLLGVLLRYREKNAVLMASHEPRLLVRLDRLCLLEQGRITRDGPPDSVITSLRGSVQISSTRDPRSNLETATHRGIDCCDAN
jgi:ATP-binding cassette subfamily C protein LapB